ncbi:hypothetical protein [Sphingomonas echinoides]|uniref:hypothetical protein n=1 Tax=Sphingomonas echinoides TaxID=59803 RepID=UPI0024132733|nr:hypothetical protein [Sphingomonas echinoides]
MQVTGVTSQKGGADRISRSGRLAPAAFAATPVFDLSHIFLPKRDGLPFQPSVAAKRQRIS